MGAVLAGDEGSAASPVWRSGYAWRVTVLMGLQSTTFYVMVSWLPAIIAADGISHAAAGWYLLVYQAVGVLAGLALPMVLRRAGQRVAGGLVGLPMAVACVGLILLPSVLPLWILLAGLSTGCALVLALSLISLGARGPRHGAQLSGMAQAIGYLLAATGPIVAGWLRDQTGSWTPTLILIAAIATTQTLVASARLP
jgi:CP family cyanate transporter-like MFS transporter